MVHFRSNIWTISGPFPVRLWSLFESVWTGPKPRFQAWFNPNIIIWNPDAVLKCILLKVCHFRYAFFWDCTLLWNCVRNRQSVFACLTTKMSHTRSIELWVIELCMTQSAWVMDYCLATETKWHENSMQLIMRRGFILTQLNLALWLAD